MRASPNIRRIAHGQQPLSTAVKHMSERRLRSRRQFDVILKPDYYLTNPERFILYARHPHVCVPDRQWQPLWPGHARVA